MLGKISFFVVVLFVFVVASVRGETTYLAGAGIGDLSGNPSRTELMGMAQPSQLAHGMWQRQYARAFVFSSADDATHVAYVSCDVAFVTGTIRQRVVAALQAKVPSNVFTLQNVMMSSTHTHSGSGGYSHYVLYDMTNAGFAQQNFDAIVDGTVQAIVQAYTNRRPASLKLAEGDLLGASINRSPYSYQFNEDAASFSRNVDTLMSVLTVRPSDGDGSEVSALWASFSVHGTSLNNTNELLSGDNKGYASAYVERLVAPGVQQGSGSAPFVAAFAQSNEGDVSPNTRGPRCPDGSPCDPRTSACGSDTNTAACIAAGPGVDMYDSARIIGIKQAQRALELARNSSAQLSLDGPVSYVHAWVDLETVSVSAHYAHTGRAERTCSGALKQSFAAGTTDGGSAAPFVQGLNYTDWTPGAKLTGLSYDVLSRPSAQQVACHAPGTILLNTADIRITGQPWTESVLPLQIFRVGQLFLVGVPGEFTTMSGRRLRAAIRARLEAANVKDPHIVIAGLASSYTHYVATYEEYQQQRYEAASTIFGPFTLDAYRELYSNLTDELLGKPPSVARAPVPDAANFTGHFYREWPHDTKPLLLKFGGVITDVDASYQPGDIASATWIGSLLNRDLMHGSSYLYVLRRNESSGQWDQLFFDSDAETKLRWLHAKPVIEFNSHVTVEWHLAPSTPAGTYRLQFDGTAKSKDGELSKYTALSSPFQVTGATPPSSLTIAQIRAASNRDLTANMPN